jgi:hypothetical protein
MLDLATRGARANTSTGTHFVRFALAMLIFYAGED